MHLRLTRDVFSPAATLGVLTIDGQPFGYVCEDCDRGLDAAMPLDQILKIKQPGKTAIPTGTYRLGIRFSPSHKKEVLFLQDVPGYEYILIHTGNTAADTEGCQLPGTLRDTHAMTVGHSTQAVAWLESHVMPKVKAGEGITYEIVRAAK